MQLKLFEWSEEKRCAKCSKVHPLSCFSVSLDKLRNICKTCISEYCKEHYIRNKEYKLKQNAQWLKNNLHIRRARNAKQRAKKLNATPNWLTVEQINEMKAKYKKAKDLESLTGMKYHVDHIVPLINSNVCGLHVPWNLQVLPANVNLSKSNKFNPECFT